MTEQPVPAVQQLSFIAMPVVYYRDYFCTTDPFNESYEASRAPYTIPLINPTLRLELDASQPSN